MASRLLPLTVLTIIITITIAEPVPPPDLTRCGPALKPDNKTAVSCCLPVGNNKIIDFAPPSFFSVRVRPAAHLVDESYITKYTKAVEAIKALGPDHPWSHLQQANIHCAYCNGAYKMPGYNVSMQVHSSWLFFPFHRMYLYFYERILGKVIGDDTFAIPFWNWDAPDGMTMPKMYVNASLALHDPFRSEAHLPPTIVDVNFSNHTDAPKTVNLTDRNLRTVYRQMVHASTAELFIGSRYVAGMQPSPGGGSIELSPHNPVHTWTGDPGQAYLENMGAFYSAGRDPMFYAHHSNVDRMWHLWSTAPGKNRKGFADDDWLNSSFIFWDENLRLVRVRVQDSLDALKLGYTFQKVSIPWIDYKPLKPTEVVEKPEQTKGVKFPVRLSSSVVLDVKRPKVARSEEEEEEEVLVVGNIKLVTGEGVKFDVYVNAGPENEAIGPESVHFAGSFVHLPMRMGREPKMMKTRLLLGLSELLSEINADGDSSIAVSLIPRRGGNKVSVGDVRIEFSS